jgi:putative nucleotidyltransferase with HDIG domain
MKILIVDDELVSRKVLVKNLESLGECVAVDDAKKGLAEIALAVKKDQPFDLVTLDVSMPGMDGKQLLQHIRKREAAAKIPRSERVKVIMVTARMNMATIKDCIKIGCSGYLLKPVSKQQLFESLGKMGFDIPAPQKETDNKSHTEVVTEIIQRFYKGKINLPVFPHIVKEVQTCLGGDSPSIEDLAVIVEKDIVISSKLISIANSPLYKGVDTVNSLNAALLRLGMKATQGVISAVAARNLFKSENKSLKQLLENLWMHSFATACLGKRLGEALKIKNTENIFLMGIIHDIGKMLLMKAIVDLFPEAPVAEPEIQRAIYEIHTTFGAVLLKKLRFSNAFIQVAELHHWNRYPKGTDLELMIINLADFLAHEIGFGLSDFESPQSASNDQEEKLARITALPSFQLLGLELDKVLEICDEISVTVKESAGAF